MDEQQTNGIYKILVNQTSNLIPMEMEMEMEMRIAIVALQSKRKI